MKVNDPENRDRQLLDFTLEKYFGFGLVHQSRSRMKKKFSNKTYFLDE